MIEDLLFGNEIFQSRIRGIGVIPADVAKEYGLSGANLRASGVDWDLRRDQQLPMAWDKADWKVWTHPDGDSFARCWVRLQETRESTQDRRAAARRDPRRPDHGQGAAHHQGARGRGLGVDREPARRDGLLRRLARATSARSASRSARRASTTSRSCRGRCKGVYVPDIITILASAVLHPRRHRPVMPCSPLKSPTGGSRCCACSAASSRCCCRPAPSSTCSCSR